MSRKAYIDGFDPDLIDGFEIDQIRPDAIPEKVINSVRLALADGERFIGSNFVTKRISVFGHFWAPTRAEYEAARDTLLGVFDPDSLTSMVFEQSGEDRRYSGVYENIVFDYKDNGFCMVVITYKCIDPFGYTVAESIFYNGNATDEVNEVIASRGNIYGLPKITATVNDIDSDEDERTLSFSFTQGARTYHMEISRIWSIGDTLRIDTTKHKVYVNGSKVDYSGRFPQIINTNSFNFNVPDAATFDVDILAKYNPRWL